MNRIAIFLSAILVGACAAAGTKTACEESLGPVTDEAARAFVFMYEKDFDDGQKLTREEWRTRDKELSQNFMRQDLRPLMDELLPSISSRIKYNPLSAMRTVIVIFPADAVPSLEALRTIGSRTFQSVDKLSIEGNSRHWGPIP